MDEKLLVTSKEIVIRDALAKVDEEIRKQGYARRDAMHLRLLAEETLGMLKAMAGNYTALIWTERNADEASINISAMTEGINYDTKRELLAVSTSGKNASSKGFMGRIGEFIENSILNREEALDVEREYGAGFLSYDSDEEKPSDLMVAWSLAEYRKSLRETGAEAGNGEEARDILEKSIVASLAKDVVVGVKKDKVDMTISMELTGE